MKVNAHFGQFWKAAILGKNDEFVAVTDSKLIARIEEMDRRGISVVEIEGAFTDGLSGLALVYKNDPHVPIVMVPAHKHRSETDLLRGLLRAYDLDQMPITGMRQ